MVTGYRPEDKKSWFESRQATEFSLLRRVQSCYGEQQDSYQTGISGSVGGW